jgi:diadenosine tetraphosphate (Ap4A) HIT family hydrolase
MIFQLHPQLEHDTDLIGHFPLCKVLLHKDNAAPWIILVPQRENVKEFHHLLMADQQQYLIESQVICQALEALFTPDKINLGSLGNIVPQLHLHHIARFKNDIAWPGPIWGKTEGKHRTAEQQQQLMIRLHSLLRLNSLFNKN